MKFIGLVLMVCLGTPRLFAGEPLFVLFESDHSQMMILGELIGPHRVDRWSIGTSVEGPFVRLLSYSQETVKTNHGIDQIYHFRLGSKASKKRQSIAVRRHHLDARIDQAQLILCEPGRQLTFCPSPHRLQIAEDRLNAAEIDIIDPWEFPRIAAIYQEENWSLSFEHDAFYEDLPDPKLKVYLSHSPSGEYFFAEIPLKNWMKDDEWNLELPSSSFRVIGSNPIRAKSKNITLQTPSGTLNLKKANDLGEKTLRKVGLPIARFREAFYPSLCELALR